MRSRGEHGGASLIAILLLTALLLALGAAGSRTSQTEIRIATNDLLARRALAVAEAGIFHAYGLLRDPNGMGLTGASNGFDDELSANGTGGALASMGSVVNLGGRSYRYTNFGGDVAGDGYYVQIVDNHDETTVVDNPSVDRDNRIRIISRGRVRNAERFVEAVIERDPPIRCVLCAAVDYPILPLDLALVGAAQTDSFDSRVGPYSAGTAGNQGHLHSNGDIFLTNLTLLPMGIRGNVVASGAIVKATLPLINTISIAGTQTQNAAPVYYPPVLPCGPPYPPNTGITGGLYNQATGLLVDVGVADTITLAPGDYCFSSIVMAGALSTFRITGPTRIYLSGPLPSAIVGVLNTTNVASNLRIFSSVTSPLLGPLTPGLTITGINQTSAVLYAPQAAIILGSTLSNFYGAIVGGFVPTVAVGGRFHCDVALSDPPARLVEWRDDRRDAPE